MQPGENPQRPQPNRPPYPRQRPSIDGVYGTPMRRPMARGPLPPRPDFAARPVTPEPSPAPEPAQPESETVVSHNETPPEAVFAPEPQAQPEVSISAEQPVEPLTSEPMPQTFPLPPQPESVAVLPTAPEVPANDQRSNQALPETPASTSNPEPAKPAAKRRLPRLRLGKYKYMLLAIVLIAALGGGIFAFLKWQAAMNNPDKAFQDALKSALSTMSLQTDTTDGQTSSQVTYDLSSLKNPTISSQTKLKLSNNALTVKGYGSAQNTYISYVSLPSTLTPQVKNAVQNGWVQLRAKGVQSPDVSTQLSKLADPRYQMVGPFVFGNFPDKTRSQLMKFVADNKIYAYDVKAVTHTKLNDVAVLRYNVKPAAGFLKLLNQSATYSEGLAPADTQAAVTALNNLTGSNMTLYITKKGHHVVQLDVAKDGVTRSWAYSKFNAASVPDEPQTKLGWQNFQPFQMQIEAQAAATDTAQNRDAVRKTQLDSIHSYLANYYTVAGSYPTLANLNSQAWVAANLVGIDPDTFRDPSAINLTLAAAPKANTIAYQATGANPKVACTGSTDNPCLHYTLTTVLSDKQPYTVQDP